MNTLNADVYSLITEFSRDLKPSEIYQAILEYLAGFVRPTRGNAPIGWSHVNQMKWFISLWNPDLGEFPVEHAMFGEEGLRDSEIKNALTAIKWMKWART